jgi:hypothetical protein
MTTRSTTARTVIEDKSLLTTRSNAPTFDECVLIADRCFGALGRKTMLLWREYNALYFGGALQVTPVLYVPTSPYGHWVGCICYQQNIYLMEPRKDGHYRTWDFVRGVLLHEMVHQYLQQLRRNAAHAGQPWCDEIMRISRLFGLDVWAGAYTVARVNGKLMRVNRAPASPNGAQVLQQKEIARWPHTVGIVPPDVTSNWK